MENLKLELIEIIPHCPDVKTFRFRLEREIAFKPGQYLILTLDIHGRAVPKAFSISNSPTEKGYIQFTKKLTESDFSKELNRLAVGQTHSLRLPMGKFTFEGEYPKVAFLSGGIGITPIRSIFKNATDKGIASDMVLLYSSRTPEYLIFREDLSRMTALNRHLRIVYTLTQCDDAVLGCRRGCIDDTMVRQEVPDYAERVFFICGPPPMVDGMRTMLAQKLSIPPGQIVTEDFMGY